MYQENTEEPNDEGREQAQIADAEARFEHEAAEMLTHMWAGFEMPDGYRELAMGMARDLGRQTLAEARRVAREFSDQTLAEARRAYEIKALSRRMREVA